MTDTTTQAVTALMENVTPGPWLCSEAIVYTPRDTVWKGKTTWENAWQAQFSQDGQHITPLHEVKANARFTAAARDLVPALLAERDAAQARARESALEALAAYGQAAEAHEAQLKAEAERDALASELAELRAAKGEK